MPKAWSQVGHAFRSKPVDTGDLDRRNLGSSQSEPEVAARCRPFDSEGAGRDLSSPDGVVEFHVAVEFRLVLLLPPSEVPLKSAHRPMPHRHRFQFPSQTVDVERCAALAPLEFGSFAPVELPSERAEFVELALRFALSPDGVLKGVPRGPDAVLQMTKLHGVVERPVAQLFSQPVSFGAYRFDGNNRAGHLVDGELLTDAAAQRGRQPGAQSPTSCPRTSWHDVVVRRAVTSYLERIHSELAEIRADMDVLLDASTIRNVNPNTPGSGMVFLDAADWGWGPSDPELSAMQMRLSARYRSWFDRFRLLFPHPTPDVTTDIDEVDSFVRSWIERPDKWDHTVPRTIQAAKEVAAKKFATFDRLLETASHAGSETLRLVPDTNA